MPVYVTVVLVIIMLSLSSNVSARSNHPASTAGKYLGKFAQTYEEPEKFYEDLREHDKEETATTPNSYNFRLPKHLKPLSYDLVIKVYLPHYVEFPANKNLTTEGEVTIKMVVMQTTNTIALNMRKIILLFDKCEARSNTIPLTITDINVEEQFERVIFFLAETLHVGQEVSLKVAYWGFVNDELHGLYQTIYRDSRGNTKIAAVTQCEPTGARAVAPCFDEPEYKAIWNMTIIHPVGTKAIANALEISETPEPDGKWKVSRFHPTPILASYLIALFVSEFEYEESYTQRRVRFRVWSTPETKKKRAYGLKGATAYMEFFEEYFGVQDIVTKQDLVALPDFSAGAMENWGLITFREPYLLASGLPKPGEMTAQLSVIAHELAHQWFGNMVTLKDWGELWLNEGFANFFENTVLHDKKDGELYRSASAILEFDGALESDCFATSRPLSSIIDTPSEIFESFDSIAYSKGGAIIQMTANMMGSEKFRKGLNTYLKHFFLQNTQGDDLWKALDEALAESKEGAIEGPDGGELKMWYFGSQWSKQMGFPIVTLDTLNSTTVKIGQRRYLKGSYVLELQKYRNTSYGYKWDVPLFCQLGGKYLGMKWLKKDEPLYLNIGREESPIVVNVDRQGYFRQNYDGRGWKNIIEQLKKDHEIYTARTRYGLISDAFAAAEIGGLDYETLLLLLEYLPNEKSGLVLNAVSEGLGSIVHFYGNDPDKTWAQRYAKKLMQEHATKIIRNTFSKKRKGDSSRTNLSKRSDDFKTSESSLNDSIDGSLVEAFCKFGSKNCSSTFRSIFEREVQRRCGDGEKASQCVRVPRHFRGCTYCYGVKELGKTALEKVKNLYELEDDQGEKDQLIKGMSCSEQVSELKRQLLNALDQTGGVRLTDINTVFVEVSRNPLAEEFMINFLIERWEMIIARFRGEFQLTERIIKVCLGKLRSEGQILLVKEFQKNAPRAGEFHAIDQKIEAAKHRIAWYKKHSKKLAELFKSKVS